MSKYKTYFEEKAEKAAKDAARETTEKIIRNCLKAKMSVTEILR